MKYRYDQEDDVLMYWFSDEPIDHAVQRQNTILHLSKDNMPVLMEVLNASKHLQEISSQFPPKIRQRALA